MTFLGLKSLLKNDLKLDGLKDDKKEDEEKKKKKDADNILELNKSLDELLKSIHSQHGIENDKEQLDNLKDLTIPVVADKLHEAMMQFKMNFGGEYIYDDYEDLKNSKEYNSLFGLGEC